MTIRPFFVSLFLASVSAAQEPVPLAVSSGHVAAQPGLAPGSVRAASTSFQGDIALADAPVPFVAASPSFQVRGIALAPASLAAGGAPYVAGAFPARGDADGGEPIELLGWNLTAPGAGAATVALEGTPAIPATLLANHRASITTPPGTNGFGNPLGLGSIELVNDLGLASRARGFAHTPALVQLDEAEVGGTWRLGYLGAPGSLEFVYLGASVPGLALPVGGVEGALEIPTNPKKLVQGSADANGEKQHVLPVPDNPAFVGLTLELQGLSIELVPAVRLRFTNRLELPIQA